MELTEIVKAWGPVVPFSDPTLHPEFPAMMKRTITPEGLTYMCTNGTGLVQKEDHYLLLTQLHDLGFEGLSFTLHGLVDEPHISPVRLTIHLLMALLILTICL